MNQSDYRARIDRVLDYIYDNLEDDLDLSRLADIACLSPYHWHRVYAALQGETLAASVKRLRLQRAADRLANSELSVNTIAARAGYAAVESFSRAFTAVYSQTPSKYREQGSHAKFKTAVTAADSRHFAVSIVKRPALRCASLPHRGSYLQIDQAMGKLIAELGGQALLNDDFRMIGVFYSDPDLVAESELMAAACVPIGADNQVRAPLEETTLPAGNYARLRYQGPYADMRGAYRWLYGVWLPNSGRAPANAPCSEEYLNNPKDVPQTKLRTNIFLPLEVD